MHKAFAALKGINTYVETGVVFYIDNNYFPLMDGTVGDGFDVGSWDT